MKQEKMNIVYQTIMSEVHFAFRMQVEQVIKYWLSQLHLKPNDKLLRVKRYSDRDLFPCIARLAILVLFLYKAAQSNILHGKYHSLEILNNFIHQNNRHLLIKLEFSKFLVHLYISIFIIIHININNIKLHHIKRAQIIVITIFDNIHAYKEKLTDIDFIVSMLPVLN